MDAEGDDEEADLREFLGKILDQERPLLRSEPLGPAGACRHEAGHVATAFLFGRLSDDIVAGRRLAVVVFRSPLAESQAGLTGAVNVRSTSHGWTATRPIVRSESLSPSRSSVEDAAIIILGGWLAEEGLSREDLSVSDLREVADGIVESTVYGADSQELDLAIGGSLRLSEDFWESVCTKIRLHRPTLLGMIDVIESRLRAQLEDRTDAIQVGLTRPEVEELLHQMLPPGE